MITRRDLVAATIAACITLACVSVAQQPGGPLRRVHRSETAQRGADLGDKRAQEVLLRHG